MGDSPDCPLGSPADVQGHLFGVVIQFGTRSHFTDSSGPRALGEGLREPARPPDFLPLPKRLRARRLHHRARDGIPAHLEDRADEPLDAQPGVLPGGPERGHRAWTIGGDVPVRQRDESDTSQRSPRIVFS